MRRAVFGLLAIVCVCGIQSDLLDAGWKSWKKSYDCSGCASPYYGCSGPYHGGYAPSYGCAGYGCSGYGCAGYGCSTPYSAPAYAPGCWSPPSCAGSYGCHGGWRPFKKWKGSSCAVPACGYPAGCSVPMTYGCTSPWVSEVTYDTPYYADSAEDFPVHLAGQPGMYYHAPMVPLQAAIPSVPAADDVAW